MHTSGPGSGGTPARLPFLQGISSLDRGPSRLCCMQDGRSTLRIKDFVNVWDNIKQCRSGKSVKNCVPLNIKADTFLLMQRGLHKYEETMLKRLGFILAVEHPHKFVIMYCQQLDLWPVAQTAWNYCNDLLRTDLCCRYPAEVLAVSALVLATRHQGLRLPAKPDICDIFHVKPADVEVRRRTPSPPLASIPCE